MKFEIYYEVKGRSDTDGSVREIYWRLVVKNGNIVAVSGEGYHNLKDLKRIVNNIFTNSGKRIKELEKAVEIFNNSSKEP